MLENRGSGILLHPTSLPGRFGIGGMGPSARQFIDLLSQTGQSYWQMLPLGPTGYGNSPYMCFSAFAGNPLLISLERLAAEGLLDTADLQSVPEFPSHRVDFASAVPFKYGLLRKAFDRFAGARSDAFPDDYYQVCERNAFWLEDHALFMALKEAHGGRVWTEWEEPAARRNPDALVRWRDRLRREIQFHKFLQFVFCQQWQALRAYAAARNIRLIGDIPIYVAHDSADVWAHRYLFHLDERGDPLVVAGVPPDYFSATGQRWGNPIYRWEEMARHHYAWWIDRFRVNFAMVDLVRLDHFRGFEAYWEIPASDDTAVNGQWVKGPADDLFVAAKEALGELNVIAEDLGVITAEVDALRERLGFPGMRILQVAFGSDPKASEYRPHNYIRNCAAYTATHDHNTTVGWFTAEPGSQTTQSAEEVRAERETTRKYLGTDGSEIHWDFIRLALSSVANLAVFPLQDLLGLGTEARMNRPGTGTGNWEWRFTFDMLTPDICNRLRELTEVYERHPVAD